MRGKENKEQGNIGAVKAKMGCVERKIMNRRETRELLNKKRVILKLNQTQVSMVNQISHNTT